MQRHIGLFGQHIDEVDTTTVFGSAQLCAVGEASQNELGRQHCHGRCNDQRRH